MYSWGAPSDDRVWTSLEYTASHDINSGDQEKCRTVVRTFGNLLESGAGDRARTGDVQLGKLHDTLISDI
jgi:hypothetical protein